MTISLKLPPAVEEKVRAGVINHDAEAVRRVLLEDAALIAEATVQAFAPPRRTSDLTDAEFEALVAPSDRPLTDEEFEALMDELDAMEPPLQSLPDSAMTREAIYGDHP